MFLMMLKNEILTGQESRKTNCMKTRNDKELGQSELKEAHILESHPLADIFPMLLDPEQNELTADIGKHGQLEPIWLYEGKILDGRNRYKSCKELGIAPIVKEYEGDTPVEFVVSMNAKRRHLNESQRAMFAAELEQYEHGGARNNQDANGHLETRTKLAASLEVSPRSVARAKKIKKSGTLEDVQAIREGKLSVSAAEKKIKSGMREKEATEDAEYEDEVEEIASVKTSKASSSPIGRMPIELKAALALPMDSQQRSDAYANVFNVVIDKGFLNSNVRRNFVQHLLPEIAAYLPKDEVLQIITLNR
jgi:ParB-like chromosome segregation protein Spo0J